jgi:hypothetical protein
MSIAPKGYELISNSRFPPSISSPSGQSICGRPFSANAVMSARGKGGISSDNFSFRTLH